MFCIPLTTSDIEHPFRYLLGCSFFLNEGHSLLKRLYVIFHQGLAAIVQRASPKGVNTEWRVGLGEPRGDPLGRFLKRENMHNLPFSIIHLHLPELSPMPSVGRTCVPVWGYQVLGTYCVIQSIPLNTRHSSLTSLWEVSGNMPRA